MALSRIAADTRNVFVVKWPHTKLNERWLGALIERDVMFLGIVRDDLGVWVSSQFLRYMIPNKPLSPSNKVYDHH